MPSSQQAELSHPLLGDQPTLKLMPDQDEVRGFHHSGGASRRSLRPHLVSCVAATTASVPVAEGVPVLSLGFPPPPPALWGLQPPSDTRSCTPPATILPLATRLHSHTHTVCAPVVVIVSPPTHTTSFQLPNSPSARDLYGPMPTCHTHACLRVCVCNLASRDAACVPSRSDETKTDSPTYALSLGTPVRVGETERREGMYFGTCGPQRQHHVTPRPGIPVFLARILGLTLPGRGDRRTTPMKIEPKTFFANERTFLAWMHMAVTLGSIAAALLGFAAGSENTGPALSRHLVELIALIMLPLAVGIVIYALMIFIWRAENITKKKGAFFDDRVGPLGLCAAVVAALTAITILSAVDLWEVLSQLEAPAPPPPSSSQPAALLASLLTAGRT
ncbi:MAG: hypothetical protein WDW38_007847 [Sanguina aurantia]